MQEAKNHGSNHELTDVLVSRKCRIQHQRLLLKNSRSGNDTSRGNLSFQSTCKRRGFLLLLLLLFCLFFFVVVVVLFCFVFVFFSSVRSDSGANWTHTRYQQ